MRRMACPSWSTMQFGFAACRIMQAIDVGDHTILIGLVEEAQPPSPDSEPLVYFRRGYGTVQPQSSERAEPRSLRASVLSMDRKLEQ